MNLREGTRRLALLLGVVGAICGGVASYSELQTALSQWQQHSKFEQLSNLDFVRQEHKCRLAGEGSGCSLIPPPPDGSGFHAVAPSAPSAGFIPDYDALAKKYGGVPKPAKQYYDPDTGKPVATPSPKSPIAANKTDGAWQVVPTGKYTVADIATKPKQEWDAQGNPIASTFKVYLDDNGEIIQSVAMNAGIRAINWKHDYGIESIEMEDGQTLNPTPTPAFWTYLLIAFFPIIGFLIPWGTIRAFLWVGVGYAQQPK